jgi:hypothetical protein
MDDDHLRAGFSLDGCTTAQDMKPGTVKGGSVWIDSWCLRTGFISNLLTMPVADDGNL